MRLWVSSVETPERLHSFLARHGRPIRYGYVQGSYPIGAYQNVYATDPGSAEMPSAGRPFTAEVLTRLVSKGVGVAPLLLHTGVASLEASEPPYAEYFRVSLPTAHRINDTRRSGGRVIAIGTTVVRALESVVDEHGHVHPSEGWTETVVSPEHPVRSIDGFLTGWHEPEASHLAMLEAIAGRSAARGLLRRRARGGLPLARVRRRAPDPAVSRNPHLPPRPAEPESPLQQLPTTRRAILNLLKRQGPLDATAVADALALTPAAIRLQLTPSRRGRAPRASGRSGRGARRRAAPPCLRADLGRRGALPEALRRSHHRASRVSGRTRRHARSTSCSSNGASGASPAHCPKTAHLPFDEQVAALTSILDEDGYLAEAEKLPDGSWRITEHNCAILTVAHGFSQACSSELAFIRDALPGGISAAGGTHHGRGARVRLRRQPAARRRVRRSDLQDGDTVDFVDLALQQFDEMLPTDLDHELVDGLPSSRSRMLIATMSPPTAPILLATRPSAPGRSGSAIRTT